MKNIVNVLIVENSKENVRLIANQLKKIDLKVNWQHVSTANEMELALNQVHWDCIISNYSLPEFSGLEAFALCKEKKIDIPFILISSVLGEEIAVEAMKMGVNDYILKQNISKLAISVKNELNKFENKKKSLKKQIQLESLFNHSPEGILIIDSTGQVIDLNPQIEKNIGLSKQNILGKKIWEIQALFISDNSPRKNLNYLKNKWENKVFLLNEDEFIKQSSLIRNAKGETTYLEDFVKPFQIENQRFYFISQRNVTQRKHAEEEIKTLARFNKSTLDALSVNVAVLDSEGNIIFTNKSWEEFGLDNNSDLRKINRGTNYLTVCDLVPVDSPEYEMAQQAAKGIRDVLNGTSIVFEYEYPCDSPQEKRWFLMNVSRFSGEGPVFITVSHQNITNRKIAEEKIKQQDQQYRLISENAADVIWVMNPFTGKFIYVSPSVEKLRGYTAEEVMQQPVSASLTPQSYEAVAKGLEDALPEFIRQGKGTLSFTSEIDQPRKDGSIVNTEVTTTLMFNESGEVEIIGVSRDITERKKVQEKLKSTEKYYRTLIEKTPDGIVLVGTNGKIKYASPSAMKIFKYFDKNDFPKPSENTHPEDLPKVMEIINYIIQNPNEIATIEYRFKTAENQWRWVESTFSNLYNEKEIEAIIINFRDVTERKQAEQKILESERKLKLFVEYAPAAIAMFDNQMRYIAVSKRFVIDYKVKNPDILGKSHYEIFPEIGENWKKMHKRCLSGAIEKREAEKFVRSDGSVDWVNWQIHPWYNLDKQIGGIILFSDVITERKEIEEIRDVALIKYKTLFDNFPLGITISDKEGKIIESNNMANEMLGLAKEEQLKRTIDGHQWNIIKPDGTPMPTEEFASVRALKENRKIENIEMGIVLENAQTLWLNVTASPIELKDYGVIITYNDISERKKMEAQLQEITKNLETTNKEYEALNEELLSTVQQLESAKNEAEENAQDLKEAQKIANLGSWFLNVATGQAKWSQNYYKLIGLVIVNK